MRPEPAAQENRAAAARVAGEVIELLEVMWHKGRDLAPTAPVSVSQLRVLYILDREDGINLRTLGEELGAAPSSVSRLCDRLQALGYVERAASRSSRREVELRLTPPGTRYLGELRARRQSALLEILERMPRADRDALARGLGGFLDAADWDPADWGEERTADSSRERPPRDEAADTA
ncbi:MarR family transcriptional regulator [Streptomyces sp. NPDC047046]|uniref:MarR family winged helix-turn-helix transcriptional regulator n=1 Tax=Streptomyces sp. NPDC047046 TaxID=3155378 RepID=UPI0034036337